MSEFDEITKRAQELEVENRKLRVTIADLERSCDMFLELMGEAIDQNNLVAENHCRRVTAYTIAMARAMEVPPRLIATMARGAFLHDIGLTQIPQSILLKPGKLSGEERRIMQEHAFRGYRMLERMPLFDEPAEIAYGHHERFDGTGYPRALKGNELPLGGRIVAVADALDAIIHDRPYRRAQPLTVARQEIERWAGSQFDPKVVATFLALPEHIWRDPDDPDNPLIA